MNYLRLFHLFLFAVCLARAAEPAGEQLVVEYVDTWPETPVSVSEPLGYGGVWLPFTSGFDNPTFTIKGGRKGTTYWVRVLMRSHRITSNGYAPSRMGINGLGSGRLTYSEPWYDTGYDQIFELDKKIKIEGDLPRTLSVFHILGGGGSWGDDNYSVRVLLTDCSGEDDEDNGSESCGSCSSGKTAGPGRVGLNSLNVGLELGTDWRDGSQCALKVYTPDATLGMELYSPSVLEPTGISEWDSGSGFGLLRTGAGIPRQIRLPQVFVDIVENSSGPAGYAVRFYTPNQVGAYNSGTGRYALLPDVEPYVVWSFEDTNDSEGSELRVVRTWGGGGKDAVYDYAFEETENVYTGASQQTWTLSTYERTTGGGSAVLTLLSTEQLTNRFQDGEEIQRVRTVRDADDNLMSQVEQDYGAVGSASVLAARRVSTSPSSARESIFTHVTGSLSVPLLQHETDWRGQWTHYVSRDSENRPTEWITQYQNNAFNASTYSSDPGTVKNANRVFKVENPGSAVETVTETLLGTVVARRWRVLEEFGNITGETNHYRKITEAVGTDAAVTSWSDSSNLKTVTYLYNEDNSSLGRRKNSPYLVIKPDGQAVLSKYFDATTLINGQNVPTEKIETYTGVPSATSVIDYSVTVSAGTKTVEEHTLDGRLIFRKVTDIASGIVMEDREATDFDAFGRPVEYKLFANNNLTEALDYSCCGLASETGIDGVRTDYTYDALGRLKTRIDYANGSGDQPPVRREFVYDALNRKTKTLLGPVGSQITEEETGFNLAGERIWTKDGLGRKTKYEETKVGDYVVRTATLPDGTSDPSGCTQVTRLYQDGNVYETVATVTPTVTRGLRSSYSKDASGNQSVSETPLDNGTPVAAAAITRWTDFAGRPWKTVSPSPTESGTATEVRYYATPTQTAYKLGQLYKVTRSGRPDMLFTYDSLGRTNAEGEDINADGALTASGGTDRLRDFVYSFSGGYQVLTTRTWTSGTTYLTETERTAFDPRRYVRIRNSPGKDNENTSIGLQPSTATEWQSMTRGGLATITAVKFGRVASVVTSASEQLSAITYAYDAYGRLVSQTDARNGTTSYTYDAVGRIASVTTPDPDTTSNDAGRRPQTRTYVYTDLGSSAGYGRQEIVTRRHGGIEGTAVEETVSEYYPTGELRRTYGANTSPSLYAYDFAGRMKTLSTWRDFNLATGAGTGSGDITTWTYNDAGLLKTKRYADSKGPDYTYDSAGRLKTREWARSVGGARLKTTYDYGSLTGDLTGVDYSDNTHTDDVVYSGHDRLGRPSAVTDGSGTRTLTYSGVYPLAEEYTAGALDGCRITVSRWANGRLDNVLTQRDAVSDYGVYYSWIDGNRLDSVYWSKSFSDPVDGDYFKEYSAYYAYEANSNLVSQISYTFYDSFGWGFSGTPLVQTRTYDYLNRATQFSATTENDGTRSLGYAYNDRNQRTRATRETGSYWSYGYDSDSTVRGVGQVASAARKVSGGTSVPGFDFAYAYDAMGNRTSATTNGQTSSYYQGTGGSGSTGGKTLNQYGSRGVPRVLDIAGLADSSATVTVNGQSTQRQGEHWFKQLTYTGNAAQWPSIGVSISAGVSTSGNLLLKEHPEVFTYDDDGNLTSDGRWIYTWDMENRLRRMETASLAYTAGAPRKRIDYSYDDRGRRTLKSIYAWSSVTSNWNTTPAARVGFLYHDWNLLQELNLTGSSPTTLRNYYWGLDLSGTLQGAGGVGGLLAMDLGDAQWPMACVSDANGNVTDVVGIAGNYDYGLWAGHYEYDAFGNCFAEGGDFAKYNPFRFSTKYTETDAAAGGNETGLVYYGFRYYNPSTGRWPNRDPIRERGGLNLYGMVENNPVNASDAFGLDSWTITAGKIPLGHPGIRAGITPDPDGFTVTYTPDANACPNGKIVVYQVIALNHIPAGQDPHIDKPDEKWPNEFPCGLPMAAGPTIPDPAGNPASYTYFDSPERFRWGMWIIDAVAVCRDQCSDKRLSTRHFEFDPSKRKILNEGPGDGKAIDKALHSWSTGPGAGKRE